jgi:hypothetical protein
MVYHVVGQTPPTVRSKTCIRPPYAVSAGPSQDPMRGRTPVRAVLW